MSKKTCSICEVSKTIDNFHKCVGKRYGVDSRCKDCCSTMRKDKYNSMSDINRSVSMMAYGIKKRCDYKSHMYHGVKNELGSLRDIREYIQQNFIDVIGDIINGGGTPTVDRIDPNDHYRHGNIRIVDRSHNSSRRRNKSVAHSAKPKPVVVVYSNGISMGFRSMSSCARCMGVSDISIRKWGTDGAPRYKDYIKEVIIHV